MSCPLPLGLRSGPLLTVLRTLAPRACCRPFGLIGRSWAMLFAAGGIPVRLYDVDPRQVTGALDNIRKEMTLLAQSGSLKGALSVEEQLSLIGGCSDIREAVEGAVHIQVSRGHLPAKGLESLSSRSFGNTGGSEAVGRCGHREPEGQKSASMTGNLVRILVLGGLLDEPIAPLGMSSLSGESSEQEEILDSHHVLYLPAGREITSLFSHVVV
ncbi:hypothetical protein CB1_000273054 [Camelus ferus]|nr:hypothetical protein CB1_000273054 [Camelus ferus]